MVIEGIGWGGEGVRSGLAAVRRWIVGLMLLPAVAMAADPQLAGFVDDDPVVAGATYRYTATVVNNDVDAATNTRLRVSVPAGASFVSASPASQNCVATTATQIDCDLGTVGANGADVRSIVLTWRALGPGPTTIAASATLSADNDLNAGNNTLTQNTTVSEGGDLSLAVTATPNPVVGGASITYTLTAANAGPNASGNLVITNNLSPSVSFVSASGSGWTCSHASGVVTCRRSGSHAVGAAIPAVTIVGTVTATGGTVTDTATVAPDTAGSTADPDINNNTATVSTVVTPGADVRIAGMSVTSATPASAGANVSFRIQPRNAGPSTAVNAVVTHTLPAGWTFVSASGPNWTCSASGLTVRCTRASLSTSDTDDISLVATAPDNAAVGAGTSYTHGAVIASDTADAIAANNSGSASVSVLPDGADLAIAKSKTPNPVAQGSDLTSVITVTNRGPRTATGPLRVVDRLSGELFVSATGTGWTCTASGADVVCNHANAGGLAVNASLPTLTIVTNATVAGTMGNMACTGGSVPAGSSATAVPPVEGDANTANDCASASATSTTVKPDLAITKTTSTPSGDKTVSTSESSATFTLVVSNVSTTAQNATGVVITDTIPADMFYSGTAGTTGITGITVPATVSGGSASFGCGVAGSTVTCTQNGGVLAPGQSVTVPITVNRPFKDSVLALGGIFTNTATVRNTAEGDPVATNNSASDTVTVAPIADVQMTGKTVLPAAVRAGENTTYTLSFRNNGPSTANGVVVTDTFNFPAGDSGLTVVSIVSSASGSTCSITAGAVLNPASPSFTCNIGALNNGQAESITLVVRPNFLAPNLARSFGNTAQITTTSVENPAGGDNGNNSQTATLAVNPAAIDLLVNTSDVPDLATVGAGTGDPVPYTLGATFINYRVRVNSVGPSYGTNVRVTERMTPPANRQIRFVCDTTTAGGSTCNPTPLCSVSNVLSGLGTAIPAFTCDVPAGTSTTGAGRGELASGQSKDIFLRFEVMNQPAPTGDVFDIQSTVSANEPDTQTSNDQEAETTTTRQRIDLRVTKSASAAAVQLRQPFNWLINVVNNGPGDSLQTDLTDTLPAGSETTGAVTWTRVAPSGTASGSCAVSGRTVNCALGQLDAGGTATVTVPVRFTSLPTGGVASNSATVDTDPAKTGSMDVPGGNNTGTASIAVQQSSLAGTVFQDRDRSGSNGGVPQAAASEPRIAGVSLTLSGIDAYGNAVSRTTTTDASGNYLFSGLSPSDATGYTVTQTQPAGYINGPVAPPASGALAPTAGGSYAAGSGSAGNSSYSAIVLPANTAATQYHFPELRQPSLSGFVYLDSNTNATRDSGSDGAISGATVRLLNAATGAVVATTTTDASGAYSFTGLDPLISYTLEQPLPASPANLQRSGLNPGLINGLACASGCTAQPDTPSNGTDRIAAIDLSAGADGTQFNFGERVVPLAAISGTVYIDRNRDGLMDASPTDGRLAGVTLTLYAGNSCSGTALASTLSDASGNYAFSGLTVGQTYTVCETQPTGHGDGGVNVGANGSSSAANAITITGLPAGGSAANHFAERLSALAGSVFLDANHDGARQGGEAGIAGVTVTLSGSDAAGNAVNRSTTTDASGHWSFSDLLAAGPGGYTVTEQAAQPVVSGGTTLNGRTAAGSAGGTATAAGSTPSAVSAIALPAGTEATAYLFGEILPVAISGTVFLDFNDNGLQNLPADTGIAGVTLQLTGTDDTGAAVSRTLTTDAGGRYSVVDLRPGSYAVTEPTQPAGTRNGQTVAGSAGGTVTPVATTPSAITAIVLATPGMASTANDFGELPASGAISGKVWLDADNSGAAEAGERGIAGVTLNLSGTDSAGQAVNRSTTTDADGAYRFDNLAPGSYTVTEPSQPMLPVPTVDGQVRAGSTGGTATAKGSTPSSISAIALALGQQSTANDFGEVPAGRIAGRVWADNNDNGVIDSGETGLAGVSLVLTGTDDLGRAVSLTVTTAADGSYAFEGLRPGRYTLTEPTQPAGTVDGRSLAGTLGGTASAAGTGATAPSTITGIVLPPGGASLDNNFGEIGQSPDLRVTESHAPTTLTAGQNASYTITVGNVGELPSTGRYTVEDQLPPGLTLAATPSGNGWTCTGAVGASRFSCSSSTVIPAGANSAATITVVASVGTAAVPASPVSNAVMVDGGGELDARRPTSVERSALTGDVSVLPLCAATPQANACRDPAPVQLPASLSGTVWLDQGAMPKLLDSGDRRLPGWAVEVVDAGGQIVARATTGSDGGYKVTDLVPGTDYAVRFRDPVSGVVFGPPVNGETAQGSSGVSCASSAPAAGVASSCVASVATAAGPQLNVVLAAGQELTQQSLPVDPSGVVYDAGTRAPVAGAVVALAPTGSCAGWNPATQIVGATLGGYTVSGQAIAMTVGDNGAYQFLIGPLAPASCTFGLTVTPPAGYTSPSQMLPPASGVLTPSGAAGSNYAVLPSAAPPTGSDTTYYLAIVTGSAGPGVVHNHIPLDPSLPSGMSLSKTGDKAQAEVGDSVRYTITVQVAAGPRPRQTTVVDRLPAGFTYIRGTAMVNDVAIADPVGGVGPTLAFHLGSIGASGQAVLKYRVRVGVGAQQGDGVNRARAYGCALPAGCVDASFTPVATAVATNEGRHAVRVSGGVFATEACVLGKVFVDCNGNHVQDREELGIPGVRLVTSDGTTLISDSEGKYSLCGLPPRSHVIKVDPSTLPRGARLTTSSNRNLGDAGSLWLDLKTGELHRADFIEGSCSNTVLEQAKARRAQGEVRAPEVEKKGGPALRFDSKAHGLNTRTSPQQGTDGANQQAPKPRTDTRQASPGTDPVAPRTETETNVPTPQLPMNRPPPDGRDSSQAPNSTQPNGGSNGTR